MKTKKIVVLDKNISIIQNSKKQDYISLTDMLRAKDGDFFISDWLRNRNTIEYLGIWEKLHNPSFNYGEFTTIKSHVGLNNYKISVKEWVKKTNAIGLKATAGRYGGTYAHTDILNVSLFGKTAKEWRKSNPSMNGNIRDYTDVTQLVVLANPEGINAEIIRQGLSQTQRLMKLNQIAIQQMKSLLNNSNINKLI